MRDIKHSIVESLKEKIPKYIDLFTYKSFIDAECLRLVNAIRNKYIAG